MHHHPLRLINHNHVRVFVDNIERYILRNRLDYLRLGHINRDNITGLGFVIF